MCRHCQLLVGMLRGNFLLWGLRTVTELVGVALKERRKGRAEEQSSKHLKMDNKKLSIKNQQLDSQEDSHLLG